MAEKKEEHVVPSTDGIISPVSHDIKRASLDNRIIISVVALVVVALIIFGFFMLDSSVLKIDLDKKDTNNSSVVEGGGGGTVDVYGENTDYGKRPASGSNIVSGSETVVAPSSVSKVSSESEVESLARGNLYPYEIKNGKVYHLGIEITGADPATFVHMAGNYSRDKDNVFYVVSLNRDFQIKVLLNADPNTFATVGSNNAKDEDSVYYRADEIIGADPSTFTVVWDDITGNYSKDKNSVYYFTSTLSADPNTFEIMGGGTPGSYAKDIEGVYYFGKKIAGADPSTFRIIDDTYAEDINRKYRYGRVEK